MKKMLSLLYIKIFICFSVLAFAKDISDPSNFGSLHQAINFVPSNPQRLNSQEIQDDLLKEFENHKYKEILEKGYLLSREFISDLAIGDILKAKSKIYNFKFEDKKGTVIKLIKMIDDKTLQEYSNKYSNLDTDKCYLSRYLVSDVIPAKYNADFFDPSKYLIYKFVSFVNRQPNHFFIVIDSKKNKIVSFPEYSPSMRLILQIRDFTSMQKLLEEKKAKVDALEKKASEKLKTEKLASSSIVDKNLIAMQKDWESFLKNDKTELYTKHIGRIERINLARAQKKMESLGVYITALKVEKDLAKIIESQNNRNDIFNAINNAKKVLYFIGEQASDKTKKLSKKYFTTTNIENIKSKLENVYKKTYSFLLQDFSFTKKSSCILKFLLFDESSLLGYLDIETSTIENDLSPLFDIGFTERKSINSNNKNNLVNKLSSLNTLNVKDFNLSIPSFDDEDFVLNKDGLSIKINKRSDLNELGLPLRIQKTIDKAILFSEVIIGYQKKKNINRLIHSLYSIKDKENKNIYALDPKIISDNIYVYSSYELKKIVIFNETTLPLKEQFVILTYKVSNSNGEDIINFVFDVENLKLIAFPKTTIPEAFLGKIKKEKIKKIHTNDKYDLEFSFSDSYMSEENLEELLKSQENIWRKGCESIKIANTTIIKLIKNLYNSPVGIESTIKSFFVDAEFLSRFNKLHGLNINSIISYYNKNDLNLSKLFIEDIKLLPAFSAYSSLNCEYVHFLCTLQLIERDGEKIKDITKTADVVVQIVFNDKDGKINKLRSGKVAYFEIK